MVERDTRQALGWLGRAGLLETEDGSRLEQSYLVEVLASQETHHADLWVIDDTVWKRIGPVLGSDGTKTFAVMKRTRLTKRRAQLR